MQILTSKEFRKLREGVKERTEQMKQEGKHRVEILAYNLGMMECYLAMEERAITGMQFAELVCIFLGEQYEQINEKEP